MSVGRYAQAILSKDGRIFVHGQCENTMFGFVGHNEYMAKFNEFKDMPVAEEDLIIDIAVGK